MTPACIFLSSCPVSLKTCSPATSLDGGQSEDRNSEGKDCGSHLGSRCPGRGSQFLTGGSLDSQPADSPRAQLTPEFPALFAPSIHLLCPSQPVCMHHHIHFIREETKDQSVGDSKDSIPLSSGAKILPLSQVPSAPESFAAGHSKGAHGVCVRLA